MKIGEHIYYMDRHGMHRVRHGVRELIASTTEKGEMNNSRVTPEMLAKAAVAEQEEAKLRERAEAREREKEEASSDEVRVSGAKDLKVGMLLRDKSDPTSSTMRVVRIIPGTDTAVLKPAMSGNRHERRSAIKRGRTLG